MVERLGGGRKISLSFDEIIVDSFAGGGGASIGIKQALAREIDIAINHYGAALAMHKVNHPTTLHLQEDIWEVDPVKVCRGRRVGLAWFSPACPHHSRARGGMPVDRKLRGQAWVAVRWAVAVRPRVIVLENVPEFKHWGPLDAQGFPDQARSGKSFKDLIYRLEVAGYVVEWRELAACDYGVPTLRRRLYLIARSDGREIVWPKPSEGLEDPKTWVKSALDLTLPCPSIFTRSRPLAQSTLTRIAKGLQKYVLGREVARSRMHKAPWLDSYISLPYEGFPQMYATGGAGVGPICVKRGGDARGSKGTSKNLAAWYMVKMRGDNVGSSLFEPLGTISAGGTHHALVCVRLMLTGTYYRVKDIGLRMLTVRELYAVQGFPDDYIIGDNPGQGLNLTKTDQIRMCGNSVCPPMARQIISGNFEE